MAIGFITFFVSFLTQQAEIGRKRLVLSLFIISLVLTSFFTTVTIRLDELDSELIRTRDSLSGKQYELKNSKNELLKSKLKISELEKVLENCE